MPEDSALESLHDVAGNPVVRERSYSWHDPALVAERARGLSGLDFFASMGRGDISTAPVFATLGIDMAKFEFEYGRVAMQFIPQEYHYNAIGSVHGGVITTLLDTVVGCAVHSTLAAGIGSTTVEIKVNFTRSVHVGSGVMRCEGKVITAGRTIGTAEGRLMDSQGRTCAFATTTCLLFPYPS
ncbi:MAG TPA: PaaI family thioesterase [Acidobacteriaceae bacterium]|nr:PaaI family thioesterase [Acidobacteriaceae bacterium]